MFVDAVGAAVCAAFLLLEQLVIVVEIKIAAMYLIAAVIAAWGFVFRPGVPAIRLNRGV